MEAAITLYIDPMKLNLLRGHKIFREWALGCTVVIPLKEFTHLHID
jgi:hypothetical protein